MRAQTRMLSLKLALLIIGAASIAGIAIGYYLRLIISLGKRGSMELQIRKMQLDAEEKVKNILEEAEQEAHRKREQFTERIKERERDLKTPKSASFQKKTCSISAR
jgi:ferritin-like protein